MIISFLSPLQHTGRTPRPTAGAFCRPAHRPPRPKREFTKSSRRSHEIAAFIFYDNTVARLHHVSPISPSPFTTHRQNTPALGRGVLPSSAHSPSARRGLLSVPGPRRQTPAPAGSSSAFGRRQPSAAPPVPPGLRPESPGGTPADFPPAAPAPRSGRRHSW